MPLDYVVVAVAAIGTAMTATPTLVGRWRQPRLRRWSLAASAATLGIGILAAVVAMGSGLSTTVAYVLIAACVTLSAVGMTLIVADERVPANLVDATTDTAPEPTTDTAPEPTTDTAPEPTVDDAPDDTPLDQHGFTPAAEASDLSEEVLLFATTTRHGWGADLAVLLADDEDDLPAPPPRRGA